MSLSQKKTIEDTEPILSVIIPCCNHGNYLVDALNSVEQYDGKYLYEVLIVNDGSTDETTLLILSNLEKKGYTILHQENQGLSNARNNGIAFSKGKYFLPLDADNKIRPAYIQKGIEILEKNSDVAIVYGNAMLFGEMTGLWKSSRFDFREMLKDNYIDACVIARKESWKQVNGYDINISPYADWDFNICIAEAGWKFHYIPEILFDYRVRNDSMIHTCNSRQFCIDYISKKHGVSYRNLFMKQSTITGHLKYFAKDFWSWIICAFSKRKTF